MTQKVNLQATLNELYSQEKRNQAIGKLASYIPELSKIDPSKLGIHLVTVEQAHYAAGDASEPFSIQSISKVYSLTLAYRELGEKLWQRVGVEPSGTAFNSLVQLEKEKGIPRNPFINAGAIVVCDVLVSLFDDPKQVLLEFIRQVSGNDAITYSAKIAKSEKSVSYRNNALINLMKDFGNIDNDITEVLDLYFHLCSIEMTCKELAESFLFLARQGSNPFDGKSITSISQSKRLNSIMQTCGFYDEAGEFSFRVGLPGKSGVGGGIIAVYPGKFTVAVWSPMLNEKGNSLKGINILEGLTTNTELSIF